MRKKHELFFFTHWYSNAWQGKGVKFTWEEGCGINGSKYVSITNSLADDSRWVQKITLKSNTNYILYGYVKGENIINHQNGDKLANICIFNTWGNMQNCLLKLNSKKTKFVTIKIN